MENELKPVPCGCGGEAIVILDMQMLSKPAVEIKCNDCGIMIIRQTYKPSEAIQAWNRAMGSAEKSSTVERTAKVENQCAILETLNPYKEGMCGNCGKTVYDHAKYCDECGARLEWK